MDLTRPIQYALIPIALCAWAVSETLSMPIWWAALLVATILIVNWLVLSGLDWLRFLPNRELLMEAFVEELRGGDYPAPPEALGEAEHYYQELVSDPSASTDLRISAAAEVAILDAWREARLQAWFRLNKVKMGALPCGTGHWPKRGSLAHRRFVDKHVL